MNKKRDYSKISNKIKTKSKYLKRKYTKRIKSKLKGGSDDVSKEEVSKEGIEGKKNFLEDEDFKNEHQKTKKFLEGKVEDIKRIRQGTEFKKQDEIRRMTERLLTEHGRAPLAHRPEKGRAAPRRVLGTPVKAGVSEPTLDALLDAGDKKADARIKKLDSKIESLKEKQRAHKKKRIDELRERRRLEREQQRLAGEERSRMLEMLEGSKRALGAQHGKEKLAGQKKKKKKRKKTKGKKPRAKKSGKKRLK